MFVTTLVAAAVSVGLATGPIAQMTVEEYEVQGLPIYACLDTLATSIADSTQAVSPPTIVVEIGKSLHRAIIRSDPRNRLVTYPDVVLDLESYTSITMASRNVTLVAVLEEISSQSQQFAWRYDAEAHVISFIDESLPRNQEWGMNKILRDVEVGEDDDVAILNRIAVANGVSVLPVGLQSDSRWQSSRHLNKATKWTLSLFAPLPILSWRILGLLACIFMSLHVTIAGEAIGWQSKKWILNSGNGC